MPRNVRPAYLTARATGRASEVSIGPRATDGYLRAALTLRTSQGGVSRPIDIQAQGEFRSKTGSATISIPRGFHVTLNGYGPRGGELSKVFDGYEHIEFTISPDVEA